MQLGYSPEAILKAIELNQRHILIRRLLQNMHILHLTVLLENTPQNLLTTDLLLERGDMQGLGGRVDSD